MKELNRQLSNPEWAGEVKQSFPSMTTGELLYIYLYIKLLRKIHYINVQGNFQETNLRDS
jgi:hypothetical protein